MQIKKDTFDNGGDINNRKLIRTKSGDVIDITDYYGKPGYEKYTKLADEYTPRENPGYASFIKGLAGYRQSSNSNMNWKYFANQLPEEYTIDDNGIVYDSNGNAYINANGLNINNRYVLNTDNPLTVTFNQGKPIERNETFYMVNTPDKYINENILNVADNNYQEEILNKYNAEKANYEKQQKPKTWYYSPMVVFGEDGKPMLAIGNRTSDKDVVLKKALNNIMNDYESSNNKSNELFFGPTGRNVNLIFNNVDDEGSDFAATKDELNFFYNKYNIPEEYRDFSIYKTIQPVKKKFNKSFDEFAKEYTKSNPATMSYIDNNGNQVEFANGGYLFENKDRIKKGGRVIRKNL